MLVHYYKFERGDIDADVLFEPVGSKRLPDVNWATMASLRRRRRSPPGCSSTA